MAQRVFPESKSRGILAQGLASHRSPVRVTSKRELKRRLPLTAAKRVCVHLTYLRDKHCPPMSYSRAASQVVVDTAAGTGPMSVVLGRAGPCFKTVVALESHAPWYAVLNANIKAYGLPGKVTPQLMRRRDFFQWLRQDYPEVAPKGVLYFDFCSSRPVIARDRPESSEHARSADWLADAVQDAIGFMRAVLRGRSNEQEESGGYVPMAVFRVHASHIQGTHKPRFQKLVREWRQANCVVDVQEKWDGGVSAVVFVVNSPQFAGLQERKSRGVKRSRDDSSSAPHPGDSRAVKRVKPSVPSATRQLIASVMGVAHGDGWAGGRGGVPLPAEKRSFRYLRQRERSARPSTATAPVDCYSRVRQIILNQFRDEDRWKGYRVLEHLDQVVRSGPPHCQDDRVYSEMHRYIHGSGPNTLSALQSKRPGPQTGAGTGNRLGMSEEKAKKKAQGRGESRVRDVIGALQRAASAPQTAHAFQYPPRQFLDIGCAEGNITGRLAVAMGLDAEHAHGCDIRDITAVSSGNADGDGKQSMSKEQLASRFTFRLQAVETKLPASYADNSFDLVCMMMVMHHFKALHAMLMEVNRVMKVGGRLFFREHDCPNDGTAAVIDVLHGLHAMVFQAQQEEERFCEHYFARYRTSQQWREVLALYGFHPDSTSADSEPVPTKSFAVPVRNADNGEFKSFYRVQNPFRAYSGLYVKVGEPPIAQYLMDASTSAAPSTVKETTSFGGSASPTFEPGLRQAASTGSPTYRQQGSVGGPVSPVYHPKGGSGAPVSPVYQPTGMENNGAPVSPVYRPEGGSGAPVSPVYQPESAPQGGSGAPESPVYRPVAPAPGGAKPPPPANTERPHTDEPPNPSPVDDASSDAEPFFDLDDY